MRNLSRRFVLDTSALMTLYYSEEGGDRVASLLSMAAKGECAVAIASISLLEFYYRVHRTQGEDIALQRYLWLRQLPVEILSDLSERWILEAGRIKASHPMSLADAQIAALASLLDATLVHKDPEYRALGCAIKREELSFKATQA